jgi:STAM-binding protein
MGWIHTHPTQSCFMSSVDCHTHCSYQYTLLTRLLMPEAIAIVCAPSKEPSLGVFRLTDPPGIQIISSCNHPDMFHTHPRNDEIYEAVDTNFITETNCVVVDLR